MHRPLSAYMNDIVHGDQVKKQQQFVQDTKNFPCLFNLGSCKLDIDSHKYTGQNVCELDVPPNKWKSLLEDLNDDSEVSECDNEVWRDNLLTYVYAVLGDYGKAFNLIKRIKDQHGMNNLVALVNTAFLLFRTGKINEAYAMLDDLKELKSQQTFADLKIDAICELGYAFRKLGGAKNLQFSISFLEFVLLFRPCEEQIQLILAIAYRRCTHFQIYSADPENINRHDCALKAATSLFKLGTRSENTSFKAAALIELAYLKYEDDACDKRNCSENHRILSREEWFQIVEERTWKQLCEEATEICDDGPSVKVLKIAGQLYRYYDDDEFLDKSEQLLKTAVAKRPSTRAHHHLGLTYKKMAVRHDHTNNTNETPLETIQGASGKYNINTSQLDKPNGFDNNTAGRQCTNTDNYGHRIVGIQENHLHQQDSSGGDACISEKESTEFVNNMEMRCSNNGSYHQGFTHRSGHNSCHQMLENKTQDTVGRGLKVLPEPSLNNSLRQLEMHLKFITKIPNQFRSFQKDNPYTNKAIHHLKQAVELSCCQNKVAMYDLACILVKAEDYEKSKETCKDVIKECTSLKTLTTDPICLVNAYNLYGIVLSDQNNQFSSFYRH